MADGYLSGGRAGARRREFPHRRPRGVGRGRSGELRLLGRADDLVIVKGKNVQPREVENLLRDLPGVDDVCVLGVDGPEGPRTVLRAVFGAASAAVTFESVVEHCRGKLAEHKIPRSVVVLPELPRDGRGKLDRRQLAEPALSCSAALAAGFTTGSSDRAGR